MAIWYIDPEFGNDAADGKSFANRKKTFINITSAGGAAPGDEIRLIASPTPVSLGNCIMRPTSASIADAAYQNNSYILIPNALTQSIDDCDVAWTGVTSSTSSRDTTGYHSGTAQQQFTIATAFTTGKVGYRTLPSTLDLSGYEGVSFLFGPTSAAAAIPAGRWELWLCSDTLGDVPLLQIPIPARPDTAATMRQIYWQAAVPSALPSGINSISLRALTDPGAVTIKIDNIVATRHRNHPDHLSHGCMIGTADAKDGTNLNGFDQAWLPINGISPDGKALCVRRINNPLSSTIAGTYGTGGIIDPMSFDTSVEMFLLNTIKQAPGEATNWQPSIAGTEELPVTISGGWDRASMSVQNGETWLCGQRELRRAFVLSNCDWHTISKVGFNTYVSTTGFAVVNATSSGGLCRYDLLDFIDCTGELISPPPQNPVISIRRVNQHTGTMLPLTFWEYSRWDLTIQSISMGSSTIRGWPMGGRPYDRRLKIGRVSGLTSTPFIIALTVGETIFLKDTVFYSSGSGFQFMDYALPRSCEYVFDNITLPAGVSVPQSSSINRGAIRLQNIGGDPKKWALYTPNHRIFGLPPVDPGLRSGTHNYHAVNVYYETREGRLGASSFKVELLDQGRLHIGAANALRVPIGRIALKAAEPAQIKCWAGRYYDGLSIGIGVFAGELAGVGDAAAFMTISHPDSEEDEPYLRWEELTITVNPTVEGVLTVCGLVYAPPEGNPGGHLFLQDLTFSQ